MLEVIGQDFKLEHIEEGKEQKVALLRPRNEPGGLLFLRCSLA